jgi:hypothetical protein
MHTESRGICSFGDFTQGKIAIQRKKRRGLPTDGTGGLTTTKREAEQVLLVRKGHVNLGRRRNNQQPERAVWAFIRVLPLAVSLSWKAS